MAAGRTSAQGDAQAAATAAAARQLLDDHNSDDKHSELFGVTELCNAFDVTPRTLRFYEDKGLLSPRRINGTRVYSRRDRARRIDANEAMALTRNRHVATPNSRSRKAPAVPTCANFTTLIAVMQAPTRVAEVGRMCAETALSSSSLITSLEGRGGCTRNLFT